jgi:hypothetical protein
MAGFSAVVRVSAEGMSKSRTKFVGAAITSCEKNRANVIAQEVDSKIRGLQQNSKRGRSCAKLATLILA